MTYESIFECVTFCGSWRGLFVHAELITRQRAVN